MHKMKENKKQNNNGKAFKEFKNKNSREFFRKLPPPKGLIEGMETDDNWKRKKMQN